MELPLRELHDIKFNPFLEGYCQLVLTKQEPTEDQMAVKQEYSSNAAGGQLTIKQENDSNLDEKIVSVKIEYDTDDCNNALYDTHVVATQQQDLRYLQDSYGNNCDIFQSGKVKEPPSEEQKLSSCALCPKMFVPQYPLLDREKATTCPSCYQAPNCSKPLKTKAVFDGSAKPFRCELCSMAFKLSNSLRIHEFRHTGTKPYTCNICVKFFLSEWQLLDHKRNEHISPNGNAFPCTVCIKVFPTETLLRDHERIHTILPYTCDICSKKFRRKYHLKIHLMIHTGEKGFKCKVCSKSFPCKRYCTTHENSHLEKPYACLSCPQAFSTNYQLKKHAAIHLRRVNRLILPK